MARAIFYIVRESFVGRLEGEEVEYQRGEVIDADDPALRQWPRHFNPLVARSHKRSVEQATASPGEKRG